MTTVALIPKRCLPKILWSIRPSFPGLSSCHRHVAHALRTLAPVAGISIATNPLPLDLHVLSLPLAFILSQDQTLLCILHSFQSDPDNLFLTRNQRSSFSFSVLVVLIFQYCQRSLPFIPKRAAKIATFSFPPNFFRLFFSISCGIW